MFKTHLLYSRSYFPMKCLFMSIFYDLNCLTIFLLEIRLIPLTSYFIFLRKDFFERKDREGVRDLPFASTLSRCPQQPWLGQVEKYIFQKPGNLSQFSLWEQCFKSLGHYLPSFQERQQGIGTEAEQLDFKWHSEVGGLACCTITPPLVIASYPHRLCCALISLKSK